MSPSQWIMGKKIKGRYRLETPLGSGGMAQVYRAHDELLGRDVAVKVITENWKGSDEFLKRFEREARSMARLSHPFIVQVYDYGEEDGFPFLVMQYMPGGTLTSCMGAPIPYWRAAEMILPIAEALESAHRHGIIHRDVKPSNILMNESGAMMLADFGIAKITAEGATTGLTGTGIGIGTPDYMAPEQSIGSEVDGRADIYALGVIFYEMITGKKPFNGKTPYAVLTQKMQGQIIPPTQVIRNLPREVEWVISRCVARKPEDRYAGMSEMVQDLKRLVSNRLSEIQVNGSATQTMLANQPAQNGDQYPTAAAAPAWHAPAQTPPMYPDAQPFAGNGDAPPPQRRKNWLLFGGVILGAMIIFCVAAALVYFYVIQGGKLPGISTQEDNLSALLNMQASQTAVMETLSAIESGDVSPEALATDTQTAEEEAAAPTQTQEPSPTPTRPTNTPLPTETPNISQVLRIAYVSGPVGAGDVIIADQDGKNTRCASCGADADESEPTWSTDGRHLVFQSNYNGSYDIWGMLNADQNGELRRLTTDDSTDEREPSMNADGDLVYRVAEKGTNRNTISELWVTTSAGSSRYLGVKGRAPQWSPDGKKILYMSNAENNVWLLYVLTLESGRVMQLTAGETHCRWPMWSPDGQKVVFNITQSDVSLTAAGVWSIDAAATAVEELTSSNQPGRPSWSSNGLIIFNTASGIDIMNADGSGRRTIINDSQAWDPAWSH
ncbi:MAG: serine/threonine-protein kinase [Anaerolineaceae bacterium]|nr:serine/threonine-protein kinase [Anaerolineaceae bacterium]